MGACLHSFFLASNAVFRRTLNVTRACRLKCFAHRSYQFLLFHAHAHPLITHIFYFMSLSLLGFLLLESLPFKDPHLASPRHLDLFFTSVSAATVSSMSTVEMEVFSNAQLIVLTVLMLIGGEVVTSTASLHFKKHYLRHQQQPRPSIQVQDEPRSGDLELGTPNDPQQNQLTDLKYNAIKSLANVLVCYLLVIHILGSVSIIAYISLVSSAKHVLSKKDLSLSTFAVFTTVSSFSSCGFIPTNENMIVFSKNTGLLLLIVPLVLLGNTLFPPFLRFCFLTGTLSCCYSQLLDL